MSLSNIEYAHMVSSQKFRIRSAVSECPAGWDPVCRGEQRRNDNDKKDQSNDDWLVVSIWLLYGKSMDNLWIIYESGWWLSHPSEKYEFVNWDDDYFQCMEK